MQKFNFPFLIIFSIDINHFKLKIRLCKAKNFPPLILLCLRSFIKLWGP